MSENNLYGFDNENIENKNNEVNENIARQDEGLGITTAAPTMLISDRSRHRHKTVQVQRQIMK